MNLKFMAVIVCVIIDSVKPCDVCQMIKLEEEIQCFTCRSKKIFENKNGAIYYKQDELALHCTTGLPLTKIYPPFKTKMIVKLLILENCKPPVTPLVESLKALNISIDGIEELYINPEYYDQPLPPANHTIGLNLKTLGVSALKTKDFFALNPDFFHPMPNLTTLLIVGTKVPLLREPIHLKTLSLRGTTVMIPNWKDYCSHLEILHIHYLKDINLIPNDWPENCSQLKTLQLDALGPKVVQHFASTNITRAMTNVRTLCIILNNLTSLPFEMINGAKELNHLDLSSNSFTDYAFADFPLLQNLSYLNLAGNKLSGWILFDLVKQVPALRELDLSYNKIFNLFCNYDSKVMSFLSHLASLQRLSFKGIEINLNCFEKAHFAKLEYLNLVAKGSMNITSLKLQNLPRTNASHLDINLLQHKVQQIVFDEKDYKTLLAGNFAAFWGTEEYNRTKLTIQLSSIECECKNYWFARALREFPTLVTIENLRCANTKRDFFKEPLDTFDCVKYSYYGCDFKAIAYYSKGQRKTFAVRCTKPMTKLELPILIEGANIISINVSDNIITSIEGTRWPNSIQWIDLRGNRLSRLEENETNQLFAFSTRRVYLSRNLFICDCASQTMLDAFHRNKDQVVDFNELICVDSNQTLSSITSYKACYTGRRILLIAGGSTVGFIFVLLRVLIRNRQKVKIYLYTRGYCLSYLSEEDVDSERPYDAFLSFSHGDLEYVQETLMPRLESEPDFFKICVHYRDWEFGGWIPTQIMRSVQYSKRTMILLSKDFVRSQWGRMELRYAAISEQKEGPTRLLVLVLDDVLLEELDEELKLYLSYKTYLRCDDPWFWQKLRYALPRRKRVKQDCEPSPSSTRRLLL